MAERLRLEQVFAQAEALGFEPKGVGFERGSVLLQYTPYGFWLASCQVLSRDLAEARGPTAEEALAELRKTAKAAIKILQKDLFR